MDRTQYYRVLLWKGFDTEMVASNESLINELNRSNVVCLLDDEGCDDLPERISTMFVVRERGIDAQAVSDRYNVRINEIRTITPDKIRVAQSMVRQKAADAQKEYPEVTMYKRYKGTDETKVSIELLSIIFDKYNLRWSLYEKIDLLANSDDEHDRSYAFELAETYESDPEVKIRLGRMYLKGIGTAVDKEKYLSVLDSLIKDGFSPARTELMEYVVKHRVMTRYDQIFKICSETNPREAKYLAQAYRFGLGVEKDLDKSIEHYRFISTRGYNWGKNELSDVLIERGEGNDLKEAYDLRIETSDRGDNWGKIRLARMYRDGIYVKRDVGTSLKYYYGPVVDCIRAACAEASKLICGEIKSRSSITGDLYRKSMDYVSNVLGLNVGDSTDFIDKIVETYPKSDITVYKLANDLDSASIDDKTKLLERSIRSSERGSRISTKSLYRYYRSIDDLDSAIKYERMVISMTDKGPNDLIDCLIARGGREDYLEAYGLAKKASDDGDAWSTWRLAKMYLRGQYVPKNVEKGKELLQIAAEHGVWPAAELMKKM